MQIRQNDELPIVRALAYDQDQLADLTIFASIQFRMVCGATLVTGSAVGDALGNLSYTWASGDTAVVGTYAAVFVGTTAGGQTQTFPTGSNLVVEVVAAI